MYCFFANLGKICAKKRFKTKIFCNMFGGFKCLFYICLVFRTHKIFNLIR